jgi:restriction endonuclease S subunit
MSSEGKPEGWLAVSLKDVVEFSPRAPTNLLTSVEPVSFLPMAAVGEVSGQCDLSQTISVPEGRRRNLTYFEDGDVIFAKITPCMENGKVARPVGLSGGCAFGSTEFHVLRPGPRINGEFLRYFVVHDDFRIDAERAMTGAVGQRRVPRKYLEKHPIWLPPVSEQERIVEILEEQFARLDSVVKSVQTIREKATQFRSALFHIAFFGRPNEGVGSQGWVERRFGEIARVESNLTDPAGFPTLPHIAPNHIAGGTGELLEHTTVEEDGVTSNKHHFYPGQILYSKIRPYLNKVVLVDFEGLCSADMYPVSTTEHPRWLWYAMLSSEFVKRTTVTQSRTVLPKINVRELSNVRLNVPPHEEQCRIVALLDSNVAFINRLTKKIDKIEVQLSSCRRSLLHAAFSGELTRSWREANV